jgi:hypothetical protein
LAADGARQIALGQQFPHMEVICRAVLWLPLVAGAFAKLDQLDSYAVDASSQSVEKTVNSVRRGFDSGRFDLSNSPEG